MAKGDRAAKAAATAAENERKRQADLAKIDADNARIAIAAAIAWEAAERARQQNRGS